MFLDSLFSHPWRYDFLRDGDTDEEEIELKDPGNPAKDNQIVVGPLI